MCSVTSIVKSVWVLSPKDGAAAAGGIGVAVFISEISQE